MNNLNEKEKEMNNLNEKEKEMNNLNDKLGLQGKYRTIVHRAATGKVETSEWKVNTINAGLKVAVATGLDNSVDYAMDALFDGNLTPPTTSEDGIAIYDDTGADWYEMDCSKSGTGNSRKFTGTFTGIGVTFSDVKLGRVYSAGDFGSIFATPTSWSNITLAAADTLTLEWTITIGA